MTTRNLIIEPRRPFQLLDWREFAEYRDLLFFLTWRDVAVRYKQSVLGWLWAFLQPLMQVLVYSIIFGLLLRVPSAGVPYPLFVLSGIIAWTYFTNVVAQASSSVVVQQDMITKVYFPRLLVPLTPALAYLVDLAISLGFTLVVAIVWTHHLPLGSAHAATLSAPARPLCRQCGYVPRRPQWSAIATCAKARHCCCSLDSGSRPSSGRWSSCSTSYPRCTGWSALNPIATVVQGFRYGIARPGAAALPMLVLSIAVTVAMAVLALWNFNRVEDVIADIV